MGLEASAWVPGESAACAGECGRVRLHFGCLLCDCGGSGRRREARAMVVRVMTSSEEAPAVLDGRSSGRRSITTEKS